MHSDIHGQEIDSVPLNMGDPLSDRTCTTGVWQRQVPEAVNMQHEITQDEAHRLIKLACHAVQHTPDGHCLADGCAPPQSEQLCGETISLHGELKRCGDGQRASSQSDS